MNYCPFFPEDFWPPASKDYAEKVALGFKICSKMNLLVVGCARDCEKQLEQNLLRIEFLRKFFHNSFVFVFENDSIDRTKILLDKYHKSGYNISFKSETIGTKKLGDKSLERRKNMAYARNQYLNYAKTIKDKIHIIIVLDLDLFGFSYTGILHSLSHNKKNSIYASNGLIYQDNQRLMYDVWAYRDLNNNEGDNLLLFNRGEDLVKVKSAFGGLSIYPSSILDNNIEYTSNDCDHVTLNNQLTKLGYSIFLNPSQITLYSCHYYC